MKHASIILFFLCACSPEPREATRVKPTPAPEELKDDVVEYAPPEGFCGIAHIKCETNESCSDGECVSMYEMGRRSAVLEQQLYDMSVVTVAMDCMNRLGKSALDGQELLEHAEKNTRLFRTCQAQVQSMSRQETLEKAQEITK